MQIPFICQQCLAEHRLQPSNDLPELNYVPEGNSCIYEFKCYNGHDAVAYLQNSRFELIFESGIQALKDGYFREAVFNFAVALERFYEYSILYFFSNRIVNTVTKRIEDEALKQYQTMWATIVSHSERQLGAFHGLYLNEIGEAAPEFKKSWVKDNARLEPRLNGKSVELVEFRNKVVHQGVAPRKAEVILYGECVNEYIHFLLKKYWSKRGREGRYSALLVSDEINVRQFKGDRPIGMSVTSCFMSANAWHDDSFQTPSLAQFLSQSE